MLESLLGHFLFVFSTTSRVCLHRFRDKESPTVAEKKRTFVKLQGNCFVIFEAIMHFRNVNIVCACQVNLEHYT